MSTNLARMERKQDTETARVPASPRTSDGSQSAM